jgi:hypothetical protein
MVRLMVLPFLDQRSMELLLAVGTGFTIPRRGTEPLLGSNKLYGLCQLVKGRDGIPKRWIDDRVICNQSRGVAASVCPVYLVCSVYSVCLV